MIGKEEALADIIGVLPSDVIREYNGLYKVEDRWFMVLTNSESDDIANERVRQMIADGIICIGGVSEDHVREYLREVGRETIISPKYGRETYASGYYVYEI